MKEEMNKENKTTVNSDIDEFAIDGIPSQAADAEDEFVIDDIPVIEKDADELLADIHPADEIPVPDASATDIPSANEVTEEAPTVGKITEEIPASGIPADQNPTGPSAPAAAAKAPVNTKKIKLIVIAVIIVLAAIYLIGIGIFHTKFMPNTTVNGVDCSKMNADAAKTAVEEHAKNYELTLVEGDGQTETIVGKDIDLSLDLGDSMQVLLKHQGAARWPVSFFIPTVLESEGAVSYDQTKLDTIVSGLHCVDETQFVDNQNASLGDWTKEDGYTLNEAVYGTHLINDQFQTTLTAAIDGLTSEVDLAEAGCYELPTYTADSDEAQAMLKAANEYAQQTVTYQLDTGDVVFDGNTMKDWFEIDENLNLTFTDDDVRNYVSYLAETYNTVDKDRTIQSTASGECTVPAGSYGWELDQDATYNELIDHVHNHTDYTGDMVWTQTAATHAAQDWGDTYVEVDLAQQHVWYYKDGQLIVDTDCVSGNVANAYATHNGAWQINYMQSPRTLKGPGYSSFVNYWMPFHNGEGLHDATWRGSFGGSIYETAGSHGCVNLPKDAAQKIYENIETGCPVLVFNGHGSSAGQSTGSVVDNQEEEKQQEATYQEQQAQQTTDQTTDTTDQNTNQNSDQSSNQNSGSNGGSSSGGNNGGSSGGDQSGSSGGGGDSGSSDSGSGGSSDSGSGDSGSGGSGDSGNTGSGDSGDQGGSIGGDDTGSGDVTGGETGGI